jgi:hypothetical protein
MILPLLRIVFIDGSSDNSQTTSIGPLGFPPMSTGSIANLVHKTMPLLLGSPDATPNENGSLAQAILDRTAPGAICDANGRIARLPPAIKNSLRLAMNLSAICQSFRVPKNRGRMIKSS